MILIYGSFNSDSSHIALEGILRRVKAERTGRGMHLQPHGPSLSSLNTCLLYNPLQLFSPRVSSVIIKQRDDHLEASY
jgi:hypothetical protein